MVRSFALQIALIGVGEENEHAVLQLWLSFPPIQRRYYQKLFGGMTSPSLENHLAPSVAKIFSQAESCVRSYRVPRDCDAGLY
jgi:hypothetical protein